MDNGLTRRENPVETVALLPFVCHSWHVAGEREATVSTDMGVPAPMVGESGNTFLFCEEAYVMEQVVVTVEALRCHRCRAVMDPRESVFQHEMMTEVSVGRHATTHTYALVDVCRSCHDTLTQAAEEDRRGNWWMKFWFWAFVVNYVVAAAFVPVGIYPWIAGLVVRSWWKRRAKRQQRLTPSQTTQQVPQTMTSSAAEERTKSNPSS